MCAGPGIALDIPVPVKTLKEFIFILHCWWVGFVFTLPLPHVLRPVHRPHSREPPPWASGVGVHALMLQVL